MSNIVIDVQQLWQQTFGGKPYNVKVPKDTQDNTVYKINDTGNITDATGTTLTSSDGYGVDIWLPIWLNDFPPSSGITGEIFLPYGTVRITGTSSMVKTSLAERIGSVKELYSIDDYKIIIKGFFIDKKTRSLPSSDIDNLRKIHEQGKAFTISNALTDIFLNSAFLDAGEQQRVVMTGFDLPEVTGGKKSMRPFVMTLESDSVFTLEYED